MPLRRVTPTTFLVIKRRMAAENFAVCPLCGALNVIENDECFVCSWSGVFDDDPSTVVAQLDEIVKKCPGLAKGRPHNRQQNVFQRFFHRLKSRLRRPFDISA